MSGQPGRQVRMAGQALARAALLLFLAALPLAKPANPDGGAPLLQQPGSEGKGSSSRISGSMAGSGSGGGTRPEAVRLALGDAAGRVTVMWHTQLPTAESCLQFQVLAAQDPAEQTPSSSSSDGPAASRRQRFVGPLLPGQTARGDGGGASSAHGAAKRLLGAAEAAHAEPPGPEDVQTECGGSTPFIEPATGQPSLHLHTVALQGLPPGQAVRYRCGSADGGWSDWRVFRAPRAPWQFGPDAPVRSKQISKSKGTVELWCGSSCTSACGRQSQALQLALRRTCCTCGARPPQRSRPSLSLSTCRVPPL